MAVLGDFSGQESSASFHSHHFHVVSAAAVVDDSANASGMMRNQWICLYFDDHVEFAVAVG